MIQKYLEDHIDPDAVLLSSPSPAGLLPVALKNAHRHPLIFARVNLTFSLLPLVSTPALAREAFFSEDLPEPAKVKTPLLILGAGRDNLLSPSEIEATARAYNTQAQIVPDVAHNSMLEQQWQSVADRILAWLNEQEVVNTSTQVAEPAGVLAF